MVGYHFTSYRNWQNIRNVGLTAYPINKPEVDKYFDYPVQGIWTWKDRPTGQSELGSILFQTSTKQSTHIVLLEFSYRPSDILVTADDRKVEVFHDGILGNWLYHEQQPAYIVTADISPGDIRLVKEYDLMELLHE